MDLTELTCEFEKEKVYSFLSTTWAVISDCDINSETLRWVGPARFTLWGVYRTICMKRYIGDIHYEGYEVTNSINES